MADRKQRNIPGSCPEPKGENRVGAENVGEPKDVSVLDFIEVNPPTFLGSESSEEAESWLLQMEQEFDAFECSDNCKLHLAEFQLKDYAHYWWLSARVELERQHGSLSWDTFKLSFRKRYFPMLKRTKAREFWNLQQDEMSVDEYSRKFSSLLMYVPEIASDREEKIDHFLEGLSPEIRILARGGKTNSFDEVLDRAYIAEFSLMDVDQASSSIGSSGTKRQKRHFKTTNHVDYCCTHCGGNHRREKCFQLSEACFTCGQVGHWARNCPARGNIPASG